MSTQAPQPSHAIVWLLRRLSSTPAANAAIGDILEELDTRRAAGAAPRWPGLWINAQIAGEAFAAFAVVAPRAARSIQLAIRDASRAIRRAPAHALYIFFILALGMAAATVTFSVVDAVVFRPLPFDRSEDIVAVMGRYSRGQTNLSPEEFWAVHDHVRGFESLAAFRQGSRTVTVGEATEELRVMGSPAEMFRVLRLKPFAGRLWTTDDDTRDPHVAVLGYEYWQRRFGGDASVLNRMVRMYGAAYRIIGIMQPGVGLPSYNGEGIDLWVPQVPDRGSQGHIIFTLGRLRPGVSLTAVAAEVQAAVSPFAQDHAAFFAGWRPEVQRWRDMIATNVRGWMLLALVCVVLVVAIACANAANLLLTRSFERSREFAVRAAIGASQRHLILTLLAESLMLSCAAGAGALLVSRWGIDAARAALPQNIARASTIALNGRVFVASVLAALATGVLFGLAPAWQGTRVSLIEVTKAGGSTVTARRHGWRSAFLVAQVGCVGALLVVCTLFITSFIRVTTLDLGFQRNNLIAVLTLVGLKGPVAEVQDEVRRIPGVTGVAAVTESGLPLVGSAFGGAWGESPLEVVGGDTSAARVDAVLYRVTPDFFAVAGIPFQQGSTWPRDSFSVLPGTRPIVIDEVASKRLFGAGPAVGRQVRVRELKEVLTVVGVVGFVFARGPEGTDRPSAYYPMDPTKKHWVGLFVRTSVPPTTLVHDVQAALAPLADPAHVRVVDDAFWKLTATRRFNASVMMSFALFAILIGAAGIYAVMSSVVAQQRREIGVRMALGASAGRIHKSVLLRTGTHLALGLAVAFPAGLWLSRGFGSIFFGVRPTDLSIYLIVAATLALVGLIGAWVPARRAARVDPIVSLREY